MKPEQIHEAANTLWQLAHQGNTTDQLPPSCRPQSRAEGYAVQSVISQVAGKSIVGWKIAATSAAGQKHINASGPIVGSLLDGQVFRSGASIPSAGNRMHVVEPEIAFVFGRDLPPRSMPYSQDEVMQAVSHLHTALELPSSRFTDFTKAGDAQLIADNACAHLFVLGSATLANWRSLPLDHHPVRAEVTRKDGTKWTREGSSNAVLGDPRIALTWMVNEITAQGVTLKKDHFVTTGTCMVPLEVNEGDQVVADYGVIGTISLTYGTKG
jgi:2-keto-4-pentenoate hydratase